ncbi:hypothetical protein HBH56_198530 [Parastagonospora nodorum]|uniref:Uncharacterized protein n=1 Tax=Phaeosphaeria nodorum (strain SN15 / ATCC MYA-4574 / FGSC 10173) TaxID=321614 RepID=A0A7U2I0S9_PHANO|nr:hypothetical protein HBH56_198530 [Parastagonospora nodorum]QRC97693.1 hypothetical protein JI435_085330 [Parastagonospora nodorum SN15]KAH3924640.1 hypothetical protein HBH54_191490 [Parastagonospora nodorum]KAH3941927.1 hypothetical protein HBH53_193840 [Parastagonospora nodorum]KAH3957829.1 hypothetical protein HBH51_218950 [Parastagonospora nodorum]
MRNTHVPTSVPSAPNHSFVSTRYTNVNAPRSPPVVHTSKSNAAWLTYPNTPARIIPQQHATVRDHSTGVKHTNHMPTFMQSSNVAQACSGFYLGLSDNGRDRVGSGLGPTGGWCFGKGVQGQLGGMSAGVRAEEWKNELFNEALSSAGSLDAEKAVELRQKWERESGSLEQGH